MRNSCCIVFLVLIHLTKLVSAQFDNSSLKDSIPITSDNSRWIKLRVSNSVFMKDNEYFNRIATGYTFFGDMLNTSVTWNPNPFFRIQAGVFLRRDFGNDTIRQVIPEITMKAERNGFALIVGTLEGNLNHGIIQPMFDFERYINKHVENGGQVLIKKKLFQSDTWIDWERMIYPGSNFNEVITAGFNLNGRIVNKPHWQIDIPVQGVIHHFGGQINSNQEGHIVTLWNESFGMRISWLHEQSFLKEIRLDNYYTYFKNLSPFKQSLDSIGHGTYLNVLFKSKFNIDLLISYWNGQNYIAGIGGLLYQSQSSLDRNYYEPQRELLLASLMYEKEWFPGFYVNLRFEPYYDFQNRLFEYSYGAYMIYKTEFKLVRLKRSSSDN
ncbi:MAG: hypothetical protein H0W62_00390 [Chitinophagales bacterium]|nr:hypothetical protein [Chitinophagales bacterium]